jgi:hypothetical protein
MSPTDNLGSRADLPITVNVATLFGLKNSSQLHIVERAYIRQTPSEACTTQSGHVHRAAQLAATVSATAEPAAAVAVRSESRLSFGNPQATQMAARTQAPASSLSRRAYDVTAARKYRSESRLNFVNPQSVQVAVGTQAPPSSLSRSAHDVTAARVSLETMRAASAGPGAGSRTKAGSETVRPTPSSEIKHARPSGATASRTVAALTPVGLPCAAGPSQERPAEVAVSRQRQESTSSAAAARSLARPGSSARAQAGSETVRPVPSSEVKHARPSGGLCHERPASVAVSRQKQESTGTTAAGRSEARPGIARRRAG